MYHAPAPVSRGNFPTPEEYVRTRASTVLLHSRIDRFELESGAWTPLIARLLRSWRRTAASPSPKPGPYRRGPSRGSALRPPRLHRPRDDRRPRRLPARPGRETCHAARRAAAHLDDRDEERRRRAP